MRDITFTIKWYDEDNEWVATCDKYPSLSYLHYSFNTAAEGIWHLVQKAEADIARE